MRPKRPAAVLFRIALAAVFGFMSLGHGPLMTFAHARTAPIHHHMAPDQALNEHGDHHHPAAAVHHQMAPSMPETAPACFAVGCFASLTAPAVGTPAASLTPLAKLSPSAPRVIVPAELDPADPPPRLQV